MLDHQTGAAVGPLLPEVEAGAEIRPPRGETTQEAAADVQRAEAQLRVVAVPEAVAIAAVVVDRVDVQVAPVSDRPAEAAVEARVEAQPRRRLPVDQSGEVLVPHQVPVAPGVQERDGVEETQRVRVGPVESGGAAEPEVPAQAPSDVALEGSVAVPLDVTLLPGQIRPQLALSVAINAGEVSPQAGRQLELAVEGHVLPASLLSGRSADAQFGPAGQAARPQRAPQRRQAELWSTAGERPVAQQPRRGRNELNGRLFEDGGGSGGGLHLLPGAGGDPPPIPPRLCLRRRRLQAPRLSRWGRQVRLRPRPDAGQRAGNPQQHPKLVLHPAFLA